MSSGPKVVMPDGILVPASAFARLPDPEEWRRWSKWHNRLLVDALQEHFLKPLDGEAVPWQKPLVFEFSLQEAIDIVGHSVWYWQYERLHSGNAEQVHVVGSNRTTWVP